MTNQPKTICAESSQEIIAKGTKDKSDYFDYRINALCALASNEFQSKNFNMEKSIKESDDDIKLLGAKDALQKMLTAQMIAVHKLQQMSMAYANEVSHVENRHYFTNTAIKLANTFIQQATLLARLQGTGGQKIVVERVDVHQGGQAIVGNVVGGTPTDKEKR